MEAGVAGAAVGATIKVLLQNLLSFPMEEMGLVWNLKKHLQNLKQSVVMIHDFLEDSEMKQVTEKPIQRWLMKLEAVAFDANDVFDELNYQILRKKVETHNKMKKQVSSFFSTSNPIALRHKMARKIKNLNKKLGLINQEASGLGLQMRFAGARAPEAPAYLETDSFSVDRVFVGRENDVAKIVAVVTSSPTEQVVSVLPIVGMGGLGKTALTREVFNDGNVISHFGKRIWVHVSENFDPVIVLKSVVASLMGENVDGSREVVLQKLQKSLGDEKYLLVLDNVWNDNNDKWGNFVTSLKGISSVKGNVIMVTTRSGNVATIVKTVDIHELGVLSEEDCWLIIKAEAFRGEGISSEFETIGANVAKRCGGLPLAAQVVGCLLRGKSIDEWVSIEKKWLLDFGGDENTVSKILKLSFDNLPLASLKKCFALCSILPKGWRIEKDGMINLWTAEGFLQNQEKDMEVIGNEVFNLLVQSSLLQVWQRDGHGNVKLCVMHDLMYDLASSVLNPNFSVDSYQVRYISRPLLDDSSPIPEEHAKSLRALFFCDEVSSIMLSNFKCLHILILHNEDIKTLPIEIGNLISLRLLDISYTRIEYLPDAIGNLYHLQTLRATIDLGRRTFLRRLPHTFRYLISLRHLYIPNIELPPEIGKLISLQTLPYFQVGDEEGRRIIELGSLNNLKGGIEIHNLEKVRDKEEARTANLFHKPNILKLKLMWDESRAEETNDKNVLEGLQPHSNLKNLVIKGFKGKSFPLWTLRMEVREDLENRWIRLDNLLEIQLSDCQECEEIPMLGYLPHLKSLYLRHLPNVKSMGSSFYGIKENEGYKETIIVFPALQKLELIDISTMITWSEVEFSGTQPHEVLLFHRLKYLKIIDCRKLKSAPSHFPCLKELEIYNMESGLPFANICGSKLTTLTKLIIGEVDELVCLPDDLFNNNRDLSVLNLSFCNNLMHLVPWLGGGGASLRKLEISYCHNFKDLPEDLHKLNDVEELRIQGCPNLISMPYPSGERLSSQGFTSLRHLEFFYCSGLTNFPCEMLESCAHSLEKLYLEGSSSLTNLPQMMSFLHKMPRLIDLGIIEVPGFIDVAAEIGSLRSLEELGIGGCLDCWDYVSFEESLDRIFPALQSLRVLKLYGMEHWDALPDQLQYLTTLHGLCLVDFGIEVLPEWIGNLSSLRGLLLLNCQKLRCLPCLTKLTDLYITDCPLLKQNLKQASDDSQWFKISHIPCIEVDGRPFSPHAK